MNFCVVRPCVDRWPLATFMRFITMREDDDSPRARASKCRHLFGRAACSFDCSQFREARRSMAHVLHRGCRIS
ncbi:hypothetical protein BD626DRAFT_512938 [Schizophyllum amplum]|uniref:Uncharacterized protein n=1 Tax=Schizophyllum amplum TaxID=97359 RepID=A0A550BZQ3_9AGAR|nr:hypothetical protein BD626DRAFT_512938 [Auriculariopsis ampla]